MKKIFSLFLALLLTAALVPAMATVEVGADMVELDIVMTGDGEIIVSHDGTADRTTNGTGSIAAMTLEDVFSAVTYSGSTAFGSRIAVVSGEGIISANGND